MCDKVYVVGHCSVAGGGGTIGLGGWDYATLNRHGLVGANDGAAKTAKSFIDCNIERAKQITIEITLKDGSKTKAVIDL